MPLKAAVAMSGGVDSSVAAALMIEKGYECTGITLKLCEGGEGDFNDAFRTAKKLGITHNALDLTGLFREEVVLRFIEAYEKGLTPNPCVDCNHYIKFGRLFLEVQKLGYEVLATGHYAQVEKSGSRFLLKKAVDPKKDQSYVLYSLNQEVLSRVIFPLGNLSKSEVREIAMVKDLGNAEKQESQDICFVPNGNYGAFMETYTGKLYAHGDILDMRGNVIGRHKGIVRYTLGQRRGLGVAANIPVYVAAKDTERNTVTLGPESALFSKTLTADNINLIACGRLEKPTRVKVKTRYLEEEKPAWAVQTCDDEIRIDFDEGQRAITPGQSAVLYDGDIVLGGGIIKQPKS